MKEIKSIIQLFLLESVCEALQEIEGLPGLTVSQCAGWGKTQGRDQTPSGPPAGRAEYVDRREDIICGPPWPVCK